MVRGVTLKCPSVSAVLVPLDKLNTNVLHRVSLKFMIKKLWVEIASRKERDLPRYIPKTSNNVFSYIHGTCVCIKKSILENTVK